MKNDQTRHWRLLVLLLLVSPTSIGAQEGWEVGGWAGFNYYVGDLNTSFTTDLKAFGLGFGFMGRYNFNDRWSFKSSANFNRIRGQDSYAKDIYERRRNLWFSSNVVEWTNQMEWNWLPYRHGSLEHSFTPYFFAGFSLFHFSPRAKLEDTWYELRDYGTEGQGKGEEYYLVSGALLFGGGFKISLNYEWSINLELSGRYALTDYLDDVSTVYPDMDDLARLRGDIAVELSDRSWPGLESFGEPGDLRGNSNINDIFLTAGFGVTYYFGRAVRCPSTVGRRKRR